MAKKTKGRCRSEATGLRSVINNYLPDPRDSHDHGLWGMSVLQDQIGILIDSIVSAKIPTAKPIPRCKLQGGPMVELSPYHSREDTFLRRTRIVVSCW